MLVTTPVTVLKTYDYSDTSKILRCLTRDYGLRSMIAKGARRPKSRFGGLVEPFSDGVATFYLKEGSDLHTLSGFELTRERQALGRNLTRFAGAGLLTELALRFAPAAQDRRLFYRLRRGLDRLLADDGDSLAVALQEAWGLVAVLGHHPAVNQCQVCGRGPQESRGVVFDLAAGGVRCRRCPRPGPQGEDRPGPEIELSSIAWTELQLLTGPVRDRMEPLRTGSAQRTILREFLGYHLTDGRPLNSLRFLERQVG